MKSGNPTLPEYSSFWGFTGIDGRFKKYGYYAEGFCATGIDVAEEVDKLAKEILKKYPEATFFGGQVVFPNETPVTRFLHNQTVLIVQRRLYPLGIPVVILPIRV